MKDRRVRLRPKDAAANYVYGDFGDPQSNPSILSFIRATNGMVWNYTPVITETGTINYEMEQPVHTNSGYNNYKNTGNRIITIQGEFYAGTATEAMYLLSCMHFVRSVSLMDFGRKAAEANNPEYAVIGSPPPILILSAYGAYVYNDIPVILKSYNFTWENDVDYIQVPVDTSSRNYNFSDTATRKYFESLRQSGNDHVDNEVWVPQKMNITIQLEQQPTPDFMSKVFNLNDFKRGSLLRRGGFI